VEASRETVRKKMDEVFEESGLAKKGEISPQLSFAMITREGIQSLNP